MSIDLRGVLPPVPTPFGGGGGGGGDGAPGGRGHVGADRPRGAGGGLRRVRPGPPPLLSARRWDCPDLLYRAVPGGPWRHPLAGEYRAPGVRSDPPTF